MFFDKGTVDIGFEINHVKKMVLRLSKEIVVGAYNMSMGKRTKFIYMASRYCSGYSIRRSNWVKIVQEEDYMTLTRNLVQSFKKYYQKAIFSVMKVEKDNAIQKWETRKDFTELLATRIIEREVDLSDDTIGTKDTEDDLSGDLFDAIQKVDNIQARNHHILQEHD